MVALRYRLVNRRFSADLIAVKHRDRVEEIGENARGHQTCDAAADDDCVLTESIDTSRSRLLAASKFSAFTLAALDIGARHLRYIQHVCFNIAASRLTMGPSDFHSSREFAPTPPGRKPLSR